MAQATTPDYAALAEQARQGQSTADDPPVDYNALAERARQPREPLERPSALSRQYAAVTANELEAQGNRAAAEGLGNIAGAVVRGAVGTIQGFAAPIRKAFGMPPATPPPAETTTAGKFGRAAEQIAEFYGGAAGITKLTKAPKIIQFLASKGIPTAGLYGAALEGVGQAAVSATLSRAQGATAGDAATSGLISGVAPVAVKGLAMGAPILREKALKQLSRVFATGLENKGPMVDYAIKTGTAGTPDVAKAAQIVRQAASDTLDLPIRASWGKWQTLLARDTTAKGQTLEAALNSTALGQVPLPKAQIVQALDDLMDESARHFAQVSQGGYQHVVYDDPLFRQIDALRGSLDAYHDTITVQNLVDLKRTWDSVVYSLSTVGKVGVSPDVLVSNSMKQAAFTGANAIRQALEAGAPEISRLNEAVSHAIQLQDLVAKLYKVNPGMTQGAKTGTVLGGFTAGGALGSVAGGHYIVGAHAGGAVTGLVVKAMESPAWRTVKPFTKDRLAQALASGKIDTVRQIVTPLLASAVTAKSKTVNTPKP